MMAVFDRNTTGSMYKEDGGGTHTISHDLQVIHEAIVSQNYPEFNNTNPLLTVPVIVTVQCFFIVALFVAFEIWRMGILQKEITKLCLCWCNQVEGDAVVDVSLKTEQPPAPHMNVKDKGRKGSLTFSAGGGARGGGSKIQHQRQGSPTAIIAVLPRNTDFLGSGMSSGCDSGIFSGDDTRRLFYKCIFIALLSRMFLLPIQSFYFAPQPTTDDNTTKVSSLYSYVNTETGMCIRAPGCIVSRTLPDLAFASAFSVLVIFYTQLTSALTSSSPIASSSTTLRSAIFSPGMCRAHFMIQRGAYQTLNVFTYSIYGILLFFTAVIPLISFNMCQLLIYCIVSIIYFLLLCFMTYFGPTLYIMLRSSLRGQFELAFRLVGLSVVCTLLFLCRTVAFGFVVWNTMTGSGFWYFGISTVGTQNMKSWNGLFGRDALSDIVFELFPALIILGMMYNKTQQKEDDSDGNIVEDTAGKMVIGDQQSKISADHAHDETTHIVGVGSRIRRTSSGASGPVSSIGGMIRDLTSNTTKLSHHCTTGFSLLSMAQQRNHSNRLATNSKGLATRFQETTSLVDKNKGNNVAYGSSTEV